MLTDVPRFHPAIVVIVIFLREAVSPSGFVLVVILSDHQHQRLCVTVIKHHLACSCALQGLVREFLYLRKSVSNWHLIEMVEKVERGFLVLRGELMCVI